MGSLAERVDWQRRKEGRKGGETGRNRGKAGSGVTGRVDTESGQRKAPRGNLGVEGGRKEWPTCHPPLPARALRTIRNTKNAPRRR